MRKTFILAALAAYALLGCSSGGSNDKKNYTKIDADVKPADLIFQPKEPVNVQLPDGVEIRAMTLNIYGGHYADADEIAAFLKPLNLDLLAVEECPDSFRDVFAEKTGLPYYQGQDVVLFSKTEFKTAESVTLRGTRQFNHATTTVGGVEFSYYATHLSWDVDGSLECRKFVDEYLSKDPVKRLALMGDFNDETFSGQITILNEVVTDAASEMGWYPGERISWPSFGFDDTEGSQLIDLIFFKKSFKPITLDVTVFNLAKLLSDHKPVMARLLFPKTDEPFESDPFAPHRNAFKGFPAEKDLPPNLIKNPGAENGSDGWVFENGMTTASLRENRTPRGGAKFFTGFEKAPDGSDNIHSYAKQTIDLSAHKAAVAAGKAVIYVSGYVATGYTTVTDGTITCNTPLPYDEGEIVVELFDASGALALHTASKRRDTLGWFPYAEILNVPKNAAAAKITLISHRKKQSGEGNDAAFDDLYLGLAETAEPNPLISGELLKNAGAENGDLTGWETNHFKVLPDLIAYGLTPYAPWSFSGDFFFYAGGKLEIDGGEEGRTELWQTIDLSPYYDEIDAGTAALSWGGRLRNWNGSNVIAFSLDIYNRDGTYWNTVTAAELFDAEWTLVEALTLTPPGTGKVIIRASSDVSATNAAIFADDFFARLKKTGAAAKSAAE